MARPSSPAMASLLQKVDEETAFPDLPDDGSDIRTEVDPDSEPEDIANVALPYDAETPLEEASEEDPDLNDRDTQETISADRPFKKRRLYPMPFSIFILLSFL